MSTDERREGIEHMRDTGKITPLVAREAIARPIEGEKLIRLENIEKETSRQSIALFGDRHLSPPGVTSGLLHDVRELKVIIYRGIWTIAGGASLGGFLILLLGMWIEWAKK